MKATHHIVIEKGQRVLCCGHVCAFPDGTHWFYFADGTGAMAIDRETGASVFAVAAATCDTCFSKHTGDRMTFTCIHVADAAVEIPIAKPN